MGGFDFGEELDVFGEDVHEDLFVLWELISGIVGLLFGLGELGEGLGEGDAYGFALGWGDEPVCLREEFEGASVFGVEGGEEDMGDLVRSKIGAFGEACLHGLGWESGIDDDFGVA